MVEQKQDKTSAQQTKTTGKNSSSTQLSRKPFFPKMKNLGKRFRKAKQERAEKKTRIDSERQRRYESPPRKSMPQEIHFHNNNGSPMSHMSQVSGATGLEDSIPIAIGHSMMQAALPRMESAEEQSTHSNFFNTSQSQDLNPQRTLFSSFKNYNASPSNKVGPIKEQAEMDVRQCKKKEPNFIVRSERFQKLVQYVFDSADVDGSGKIIREELYCGLIMIHLKLAAYVGPAACRVAAREYVYEIFDVLDRDKNGYLEREEFGVVMALFGSQILTRVLLQLGMTLLIVPIVAQYVLDIWMDVAKLIKIIVKEIDNAELVTERLYHFLGTVLNFVIPAGIKNVSIAAIRTVDQFMPRGAIDALPLTIISILLGMLLVPWMLYQIDEFHSNIAEKKNGNKVKTN